MLRVMNSVFAVSLVMCGICHGEKPASADDIIMTLFSEIGFSPSCVSKSLAICENTRKNSVLGDKTTQQDVILDTVAKIKAFPILPRNCADLLHQGYIESGVRTVYPYSCCPNRPVGVFCDQATDSGGWTVFQLRQALPQREDFFRKWTEYRLGFGVLDGGEFWLGLDSIHALVSDTLMELRVDLEDYEGKKRWAKYEYFFIGDASDQYRLELGEYSGNAGDSLTRHNGHPFSTKDKDNDEDNRNCASVYKGAWWYGKCHSSNLNGFPHEGNHTSFADGINWKEFRGYHYSLKRSTLSVRPKFYNAF